MKETPKQSGFRMPAEWEPHEATWLAWPHNLETWPEKFDKIPQVWAAMAKALCPHEKVNILVNDAKMEKEAKELLGVENVFFHHVPTNDAWIRDFGPIFVKNEKAVAMTDWIFNTWGERWEPRPLDNAVPKKLAGPLGVKHFEPGIVLEGGSIDPNGRGSLLTTESCLLSRTRNPHLSRKEIEETLNEYLGITNVIWLKEGIAGDDTSGHVDDLARFVKPDTVVCVVEKNRKDPNYEILQKNFEILQKATDQDGKPLKVLPLPMPRRVDGPKGKGYPDETVPASYANFYIANHVVLLPIFHQESDAEATYLLQSVFPDRTIVPIDGRDLVWGLGGIHCVTQQQPA
ncbi:MAG: agmatine deiminase family protein [Deltaproteobacteria bacterium]|nr:agmatine deiminase family protein [Deltaproteobacteria bacterium]